MFSFIVDSEQPMIAYFFQSRHLESKLTSQFRRGLKPNKQVSSSKLVNLSDTTVLLLFKGTLRMPQDPQFLVGAFCEHPFFLFFSPDHTPHIEKSTFYRISLGFPILLIGCFQKGAIVFDAFFVSRQHRRFDFTRFTSLFRFFEFYLPYWIIKTQRVPFCVFWHCETFSKIIFWTLASGEFPKWLW